jgi:dTDP-4-amino-4,6-dideoxygalactose transaminase
VAAVRTFERAGFLASSIDLWFHKCTRDDRAPHSVQPCEPARARARSSSRESVENGHISGDGPFTRQCEALLEKELGVTRALLTTSCTHALELAALLLDVGPGDEVRRPSFTFVSGANAFALRGATLVFADVRPDTLNLDERQLRGLVPNERAPSSRRTTPASAVSSMRSAPRPHRVGADVVEDNAHGLFGGTAAERSGTFGTLAAQSFHETKNVTMRRGGRCPRSTTARSSKGPRSSARRARTGRSSSAVRSTSTRGSAWARATCSPTCSAAFLYAQLEARDRIQTRASSSGAATTRPSLLGGGERIDAAVVPDHCEQSFHMYYVLLPSFDARSA